jgi:SpoVK/Ycf46/Vps4 family AAA+-type ATPase
MVFSGNPGTGKTTVADFIGEIYASMGILSEGNVIKVTKKDLVGVHVGETERKMNQVLERAKGNVLFIDEAYELDPKNDSNNDGRIVLDALVDELGGDNVNMIVILAGYPQEMKQLMEYNPGLESRFPNVFHFNDYSVEELLKIALQSGAAKDFTFTAKAKERLEAYIRREVLRKQKSFGNGRFVTRLITNTILPRMATRLASVENPTVKQLKTILAEDIPITADQARSVNETGFDEKLISQSLEKLDAMVGLSKVKQAIHNFVDVARYRNSIGEKFVGSGVLKWSFAGNSGTGKSTVAKIFADILKGMNLLAKGNFVEVKGEQIFNVSEYACDQVLKSAVDRSRYGVLFVDGDAPEFRERGVYALTNEQLKIKLSQLTTDMGGAGAIIVAECDAPRQSLVSSLALSGVYEFDHTIVFDDYSADELFEILRQCLAGHKVKFTPEAEQKMKSYIGGMLSDKGPQIANARTMKLLSRTIYEIVMLRESRNPSSPRRTVLAGDVAKFKWKSHRKRIGY